MVVCKFFQQGYCRYGQNCRFEHVYGSKYTYHAPSQPQAAAPQVAGCTDEQLVNQVQADMQSALRGGQWILSCYSPYKDKPLFPGISDLSPEEARLFIYEAKNSNNIEQAVNYMNNMIKDTRQKYEQLLQPNVNIIKVLRALYKGETMPSPFSDTAQGTFGGTNAAASSIFRSAVQNTQPMQDNNTAASIFSQGQNSIFNSQPDHAKDIFSQANNSSIFGTNADSTNAFGQSNQNSSNARSIFASAVQQNTTQPNPSNLFSSANQSIFGAAPTNSTSPFSQAQNNSPFSQTQSNSPFSQTQNNSPFSQTQNNSPFSQPQNNSPFSQTQNSSPFSQAQNNSPFSQNQNASPFSQGNVFQKAENPASIFGQMNMQMNMANEPGIYSKMEDISETDLEAFKSDCFELGFVPEVPPPHQLCTR